MSRTPFAETEIFLAVMEGDEDRARDLIGQMYRGELTNLQRWAERVDELAMQQLDVTPAVPVSSTEGN